MKDDFEKNTDHSDESKLHTLEYTLRMIADYAREAKHGDIYISSCHSAVGYWIAREPHIKQTDEIVLLGAANTDDKILHSIIVRDGQILGDTEAQSRGIETRYDKDSGDYQTMHSKASQQEITYVTKKKMNIAEFTQKYLTKPDNTPDISDTL